MQNLFFYTRSQLEEGWILDKNVFRKEEKNLLPLNESKLTHILIIENPLSLVFQVNICMELVLELINLAYHDLRIMERKFYQDTGLIKKK